MPIPLPEKITAFDNSQVPILQKMVQALSSKAPGFKFTEDDLTTDNVQAHEIAIKDDGLAASNSQRIVVKTGKNTVFEIPKWNTTAFTSITGDPDVWTTVTINGVNYWLPGYIVP